MRAGPFCSGTEARKVLSVEADPQLAAVRAVGLLFLSLVAWQLPTSRPQRSVL